jgi:hypothetical protein
VVVTPGIGSDPATDTGRAKQIRQLYSDIRSANGVLTQVPSADVDGSGDVDRSGGAHKSAEAVVALACAASATTAITGIFKTWLRERRRTLVFTISDGTRRWTVVADGATSDETLQEILRHAVPHDGDGNG